MVGRIAVLAAVVLATIVLCARASTPAPAFGERSAMTLRAPRPAPAPVPPDLQALEQKMLALQLTSERFSTTVSVAETPKVKGPVGGFKHIFGRASSLAIPLATEAGEVSFGTPLQASVDGTAFGIAISARLIGTTLYTREPFISQLDGGRPWVEERNKSLSQALGSEPAGPGGYEGEAGAGLKTLGALIGRARSIAELGPANVDGQAVTRFKLSIPLTALLKPSHSRKQRLRARLQRKLFAPLVSIELFLTETGLPVRTGFVLYIRHDKGELIEQSDVTAIDIPVLVQAPPVAETIGAAQLHRLIHRRKIVAMRRAHRMSRGKARSRKSR